MGKTQDTRTLVAYSISLISSSSTSTSSSSNIRVRTTLRHRAAIGASLGKFLRFRRLALSWLSWFTWSMPYWARSWLRVVRSKSLRLGPFRAALASSTYVLKASMPSADQPLKSHCPFSQDVYLPPPVGLFLASVRRNL